MNPTTTVAQATPTNAVSITPEQQALLNKHAQEFAGSQSNHSPISRINIAKVDDLANQITAGDFTLSTRVKDKNNNYETKITSLGKTISATILIVKMRYLWFDRGLNKFVIQTNEFDSFDKNEKICVYEEGKLTHEVSYSEFKELKKVKWQIQDPRGSRSALKLSYIAYVMVNNQIAAMNIAMSSYVGMVDGKRDFKIPEQGSLLALQNSNQGVAPYAYAVNLTAEKKAFKNEQSGQTIEYYRTVFTRSDDSNLLEMLVKRQKAEEGLAIMNSNQYERGKKLAVADEISEPTAAENTPDFSFEKKKVEQTTMPVTASLAPDPVEPTPVKTIGGGEVNILNPFG